MFLEALHSLYYMIDLPATILNRALKPVMVVILLCCDCTVVAKQPKHYHYKKHEFNLQQPTLIRTDGVYIDTATFNDGSGKRYCFLRFYENGRLLESHWYYGLPANDSLASRSDLDNRTYYRNTGNSFSYEIYEGWWKGYGNNYGDANSNSLEVTAYKWRGWSKKQKFWIPQRYFFKSLTEISKTNW